MSIDVSRALPESRKRQSRQAISREAAQQCTLPSAPTPTLKHPFDEAAARIASLGYEGLELLADVPHAWPAGLLDGQKRAILAAMERSGSGSRTSTRS